MAESLENDIVAWAQSHDEAAARRLVDALYPQVVRIIRGHLPRGADERDLAQEVFRRLFRNLHRYRPEQPLEHWLSRITLNVCRNAQRTRVRKPELRWSDLSEGEQAVLELTMETPEAVTDEHRDVARELLQRALETLSPADQQVIRMLHLEEKEVAQIAAATGWSATGVRVRAFRARLRLKRALRELGERFGD